MFHAVSELVLLHDDQVDLTTEQRPCIICCFLVSFFCCRTLSHPFPRRLLVGQFLGIPLFPTILMVLR